MANGVNKVILVGNLGADPDVRYTQAGSPVANLRVAVGERRKVDNGWVDHTEWVSVVCFGKTAENAGRFLKKGRQIYVEGRLQTRKWQDREGNDRWSTEVIAHQLLFLSDGSNAGDGGQRGGQQRGAQREQRGGYGGQRNDQQGQRTQRAGQRTQRSQAQGRSGYDDGFQDDGFVDDDIPF